MDVADKRVKLLQTLVEESLQTFLQSISAQDQRQTFELLYLNEAEQRFLAELSQLAITSSAELFQRALEDAKSRHPGVWPIALLPTKERDPLVVEQWNAIAKDKRIAIVGPSQSLMGSEAGDKIDSYDIVVRVNNQWPIQESLFPDLGRRMDVLYHCCNADYPLIPILNSLTQQTQFVWFRDTLQARQMQQHCMQHSINCASIEQEAQELTQRLGCEPNTGLLAIKHVVATEAREILIIGFSFFKDPYYAGYRGHGADAIHWDKGMPTHISGHDLACQLSYFAKNIVSDSRVALDTRLAEIVEQELSK